LPDDVPMQPAQDCTEKRRQALRVSYGRFRLESLLCRRSLGLFEEPAWDVVNGEDDHAFEIGRLSSQLHTLGATRACCFCCASRI